MQMSVDSPTESIHLTLEQAQTVVTTYLSTPEQPALITSLVELPDHSYISSSRAKSSLLILAAPHPPALLLLTLPSSSAPPFSLHPLSVLKSLHNLITTNTHIPLPPLHTLSTSLDLLPYHYALFSAPSISPSHTLLLADALPLLSPTARARIDLERGVHLQQLHGLQNDFFGAPSVSSAPTGIPSFFSAPVPGESEPFYSWQEAFTPLLDALLGTLANTHPHLAPWEDLRRALGRAVAFYLFDDAEVPCLVGTAGDVWVTVGDMAAIACVHPAGLLHAWWGDPLLEALLLPPGPSDAILEAYNGGAPLTLFPRQRTKRLWYLFYLAGRKLCDGGGTAEADVVRECAEKLRDAPCY